MLADTSMDVVLGMPFLAFSNVDILFDTESFTWRTYSFSKMLPIARQVELLNKHIFPKPAFNKNSATFVLHITDLKTPDSAILPSWPPLLAVLQ